MGDRRAKKAQQLLHQMQQPNQDAIEEEEENAQSPAHKRVKALETSSAQKSPATLDVRLGASPSADGEIKSQ